jgi:hypothetical protein
MKTHSSLAEYITSSKDVSTFWEAALEWLMEKALNEV